MASTDGDDRIERLVRTGVGPSFTVLDGPVWLTILPDRPTQLEHGWKLHLSSRAANFPELVAAVLPVLVAERCGFKLARSQHMLAELNDGVTSPATVGKAITIYPDQDRVRDLGLLLAEILAEHRGPRILSDKRVAESAPVYYRYGPFVASPVAGALGELESWLHGPDGERFEAVATLAYRQPPWVVDPFTGQESEPDQGDAGRAIVGGRYRLLTGIRESARGNVYRALDQGNGDTVIVKQARALVSEGADHTDARLRLRNERRLYEVLAGVPGVPRFIDHFQHGDDEFLVTSDCGERTLAEDVVRAGPYLPGPDGSTRSLRRLAQQVARIVRDVHKRGVCMRDLTPANIVLGTGTVSLIDFGLASHAEVQLGGGTPGYAPARQLRDAPAHDTDDLYALGMTLLFAATRQHPVALGEDGELPLLRALQALRALYGPEPAGIMGALADLLGAEQGCERARRALSLLADGKSYRRARTASPLPALPPMTAQLVAEIVDSLRSDMVREADRILAATSDMHEAYDGCVYSGTAGIGLELLQHLSYDGVAERVHDLVTFTDRAARLVRLQPGLYSGRTGVDVFLQRARDHGIQSARGFEPTVPPAQFQPEGDDLIVGAAGVGLGHLYLFRSTGDDRHFAVAERCARLLTHSAAPSSSFRLNPEPECAVEASAGMAHGLAGVTELLVSFAEQADDPLLHQAAALSASLLANRARRLVQLAQGSCASPLAASWCQGLTGIGRALAHASILLADAGLASLAHRCGDVCVTLLPRLGTLGQCCGAAGVGSFLIDLGAADGGRYLPAAYEVAAHMLRRSAGTPDHPIFTDSNPDSFGASWAAGLAGMLTFFRRLADPAEPDILPGPMIPARSQGLAVVHN